MRISDWSSDVCSSDLHALSMASRDGVIDLHRVPAELDWRRHRELVLGRLQHLDKLGLAEKARGARWALRPGAEPTFKAMGERGDTDRTLQRTFVGRTHDRRTQLGNMFRIGGGRWAGEVTQRVI